MARVKRAVNAQKKKRKVMKLAKGYFGAKSKQYRAASEQVRRSLRYAYIGRKQKKRDFRSLWIARINAAARLNGLSYSRLMNGAKCAFRMSIISWKKCRIRHSSVHTRMESASAQRFCRKQCSSICTCLI